MSIAWAGTAVLFVLILIMLFAVAPVIAHPVEVRVNAPEYVVESGTFDVTIDVDGVSDLNSVYFYLSFVKSVVKVTHVADGKIDGEKVPVMWNVNPDKDIVGVAIMMPLGEGVSGSGYLAEIEFEVKGDEGEKSELKFFEGELSKAPEGEYVSGVAIPATWINATVTIGQPTPGENEEEEEEDDEDEEPTPTPTLEPVVTPILTPEANVTETAETTPTPTLAPSEAPVPTPTLAPGETLLQEPTPVEKTKTTSTTKKKAAPTPKPEEPGFEAILVIAMMPLVTYILLWKRNRKK